MLLATFLYRKSFTLVLPYNILSFICNYYPTYNWISLGQYIPLFVSQNPLLYKVSSMLSVTPFTPFQWNSLIQIQYSSYNDNMCNT